MKRPLRIALIVETSRAFGRGIVRGVTQYSRIHGPFEFCHYPPNYIVAKNAAAIGAWLKKQNADGIILEAHLQSTKLKSLNVPTAVLDITHPSQMNAPINILSNEDAVGQLAAEYFINRGFRHFAFFGLTDMLWSRGRCESFRKHLRLAGYKSHCFEIPAKAFLRNWDRWQPRLHLWLDRLPKPLALFVGNDDYGRVVLECCKKMKQAVPESIAVLGVDNDEMICELTHPPLSSIALNTEKAGFEASEYLVRMIRKTLSRRQKKVWVQPTHIVTRRSTNIDAIDDPEVCLAIRYIHNHVNEPIHVTDIVKAAGISRRNLYKRCMAALDRPLSHEIARIRTEKIKEMLSQTTLSVSQIARAMNFSGSEKLHRFFRRETGTTPLAWRKQTSSVGEKK